MASWCSIARVGTQDWKWNLATHHGRQPA
jgi:hypothetical protein